MPSTLPTSPRITSALEEYRRALIELYGRRLLRLVLFGSQARGDAKPDSDVDVLIVLRGPLDLGEEIERTSLLRQRICLDFDVLMSSVYKSEEDSREHQSPLIMNIRREGIEL